MGILGTSNGTVLGAVQAQNDQQFKNVNKDLSKLSFLKAALEICNFFQYSLNSGLIFISSKTLRVSKSDNSPSLRADIFSLIPLLIVMIFLCFDYSYFYPCACLQPPL